MTLDNDFKFPFLGAVHGMSRTKTYQTWIGMIARCTKPENPNYKNYGARGIKVCKRWQKDFMNFYRDMGEAPKDLSLERIDNEKGYTKENCKWATRKEQNRNTRKCLIGKNRNGWEVLDILTGLQKYHVKCEKCSFERFIFKSSLSRIKCKCNKMSVSLVTSPSKPPG